MKRALVTGAGGFIGRHLCRKLVEEGNSVVAVDKAFRGEPPESCSAIEADILDKEILLAAMAGVDIVYHLAAYTDLWAADPTVFHTINVTGTQSALNCAKEAGVKRFVHCSSFVTIIFGKNEPEIAVDETANPTADELLGDYAVSKLTAEQLVLRAQQDMDVVIVMPSAPIGPADHSLTPPTRLLRDIANGDIPATVDQLLNLVDVSLLASGIFSAGNNGKNGERYLLVGENVLMKTFLDKIKRVSGVNVPRFQIPYSLALAAAWIDTNVISKLTRKPPKAPLAGVRLAGRKRYFKADKARKDLNFVVLPIDDAIHASLRWLQANGHIRRRLPKLGKKQQSYQ